MKAKKKQKAACPNMDVLKENLNDLLEAAKDVVILFKERNITSIALDSLEEAMDSAKQSQENIPVYVTPSGDTHMPECCNL